jgi:hypothetical protein
MKNRSETRGCGQDRAWLERENPEIYYLLRAMDQNAEALRWLQTKGEGLYLFARALGGDRKALQLFKGDRTPRLDEVYDTIYHCDLEEWLGENYPDLHLLFEAVRGDEASLKRLRRKKVALGRLAEGLRAGYRDYHEEEEPAPAPQGNGSADIPEGAAADVGLLIGEMHLKNGEFHKAVEAFSRSLESEPTADAYDGRARAYLALAADDERSARGLRDRAQGHA